MTLSLGFSFLPLDEHNLNKVVGPEKGDAIAGFNYLTAGLIEVLRQCSQSGDLAYIETEYSGGDGTQGAVVFQTGGVNVRTKDRGDRRDRCSVGDAGDCEP